MTEVPQRKICRFLRGRSASLVLHVAVVLGLSAGVACGASDPPERTRVTINDTWRYAPGNMPSAAEVDFDDGTWERVDLPHTWNAEDAFDKTPGYRRGTGWYRKHLSSVDVAPGRRHFVYFEGANQVADVFMNGVHVGRHVGGYTAFVVDVTDELNPDGPNVLAVRVDNAHDPDIPPLDADFTFYGGIYRDVWYLSTDEVHIDVMDHAAPGIFVDTPEALDSGASVRVRGAVVNESSSNRTVTVRSEILDNGEQVAGLEFELEIAAGTREPFEVTTPEIPDLKLWSPDSPYLYSVRTDVFEGDRLVDRVTVPLGIRWMTADGHDGFTLNGKPLRLSGTNRHQDFPGFGNAVPNWVHRKDVSIIKDTGFNFLRLAHYPQDPVVLEETDRQGLVVWEEIPIVNMITMSDAFDENSESMLVEMIRQHYNHPSILMWGFMNEVMLRVPKPVPAGYYDRLLELAERLESVVKSEDASRATVMAQSVGEVYNGKGLSDVTDILGMNLYFGWYYGTLDSLGAFLDRVHAEHPDRPLIISEYGAGSDERVHTTSPRAFDFSSEHAQDFHLASFRIIRDRPYLVGSAVWNQFDFGSEGRQDTKNAINQKGLYFFNRTPKDVAYYYQAALLDKPVLHIADEWSRRAGSRPEDALQSIRVYTNAPRAEIWVNTNDNPQGSHAADNHLATWRVKLKDGPNLVKAAAYGGAKLAVDNTTILYDDRSALFGSDARSGQVLAVNAGGHYQYVGSDDLVWEADRAYTPGNWGFSGGAPRLVHHRIQGTDDDPIFQAARDGVNDYRFDVADGNYEVEILLCETRDDPENRGAFMVSVNGSVVWTDLDLADSVGLYSTTRRTIDVVATGGKGIEVTFEPAGSSTVSGILIRRK